jgi:hypothetical protein
MVHKIHEERSPNVSELLGAKKLDLIVMMPRNYGEIGIGDGHIMRSMDAGHSIPLINNVRIAKAFVRHPEARHRRSRDQGVG